MMTQASPFRAIPTFVRRPDTGDAIGPALRDAYGRGSDLPDDIASLLARLRGMPQ